MFLKNKGIHSLGEKLSSSLRFLCSMDGNTDITVCGLGVKAHADILRMVATLLVLQLMRVEKLDEGRLLRTLFCLESSEPR